MMSNDVSNLYSAVHYNSGTEAVTQMAVYYERTFYECGSGAKRRLVICLAKRV